VAKENWGEEGSVSYFRKKLGDFCQKRSHDTRHNDTRHNDIQHNEIQHNDTQQNDTQRNDIHLYNK
jgi:hypothetical protein